MLNFYQIAVKNPQNQRFFIWVLFGSAKYLHDTQAQTGTGNATDH